MALSHRPSSWHICLDAWVIQDGNYADLEVGQTVEFAVEFWQENEKAGAIEGLNPTATRVKDWTYNVAAKVEFNSPDITVVDFGILAFRQAAPQFKPLPEMLANQLLEIRVGLGIDPFFYFERLNKLPDVPPLIYSWKILSIQRLTGPCIEQEVNGTKLSVRDPAHVGFEEILKTDAWKDDGGVANYLLHCELLPVSPRRERSIEN
jgi:hypothetical protein